MTSRRLCLLLFFAANVSGVVGASADPPAYAWIGFVAVFILIVGLCYACINSAANPEGYFNRMRRLQMQALEAQIRQLESAPLGAVVPVYNFGGNHMHTQTLTNSHLALNPAIPSQQMVIYPMLNGSTRVPQPDMPPVYSVAITMPHLPYSPSQNIETE